MIHYNKEYNKKIREICDNNPTSYMNILKGKNNVYLFEYILKCISGFLDINKSSYGKMINWVLNEYQDFPKCKNPKCNNKVIGYKFLKYNDEWQSYCCNKCAQSDERTKNKVKEVKQQKYGNPNYNGKIEEIKKKNKEKYGCEWYFQTEDFKNKTKETWKNNGYDHPMHSENIKKEMENRYEGKYGVKYSILNHDVIIKSRQPYYYDGNYFKSSWELAYYIYLKDNNIKFEYQPDIRLEYKDKKGKDRYYFPDFLVEEKLIEIKGTQFIKEDGTYQNPYDKSGEMDHIYEAKHKCMEENGVKIISEKEIKEYLEYCSKKFNNKNWKHEFKTENPNKNFNIQRNDGNLLKEFEYYKNTDIKKLQKTQGNRNYIIKYFQQDTFFKHEKELLENEDIRRKLIDNRIKYIDKKDISLDDLLTGFKKSGIYYGYSHFNPMWFKWFIKEYNVKTCYDPCGGWGHRLLGALNLEKYIYNDLSKTTKNNVDRIIKYFDIKNTITYNEDAKYFKPKEKFESIFTCPPYYNVEEYECGKFKDIEEYNNLLHSIFKLFKETSKCKIFGLVIRDDFLLEEMKDFDFKFDILTYKSKYLSNNDNLHKEHLYIFLKNN